MANQLFPHRFKNLDQGMDIMLPAVYKLHFGSSYFIWKGKTLRGSVEQNLKDLHALLYKKSNPAHLFAPIVTYVKRNRILEAVIEVIIQTEDPALLVQTERDLLEAGRNEKLCLNNVFEPHIPKWIAEALTPAAPVEPAKPVEPVRDILAKQQKPAASNKARRATMDKSADRYTDKKPDNSTEAVKTAPGKFDKLREAFSKIKTD
jgi:hypothetical protein